MAMLFGDVPEPGRCRNWMAAMCRRAGPLSRVAVGFVDCCPAVGELPGSRTVGDGVGAGVGVARFACRHAVSANAAKTTMSTRDDEGIRHLIPRSALKRTLLEWP